MKRRILMMIIASILLVFVWYSFLKGVPFTDLVPDKVVKITTRLPGNGLVYATTDGTLIDMFITEMKQGSDYYKSYPVAIVGNSSYRLINTENMIIAEITFYEKGKIRINDTYYNTKIDIKKNLKPFFKELFRDEHIVKSIPIN